MTGLVESELAVSKEHLPHRLDDGLASRAAIGLIVLATDQTLEHEFRRLLDLPGVAFYESRILNEAAITPATLKAMEARLTAAAEVILPGLPLDVVAFGCTSAAMVIGEAQVFARIRAARPGMACTTPITAAFAAFAALGARRIALLTPYRADINRFMREYIEARGFAVPVMGSFNEEDDRRAARIDQASIRDAKSYGPPRALPTGLLDQPVLHLVFNCQMGATDSEPDRTMPFECTVFAGELRAPIVLLLRQRPGGWPA